VTLHIRLLKWDLDLMEVIERLKQEEKVSIARCIRINESELIEVQGKVDVNNSQLQKVVKSAIVSFDKVRETDFQVWVDRNTKFYPTVTPRS